MGVAVPTAFVSTNDLISVRNSLVTLFESIDPNTGELPFAGPPVNFKGARRLFPFEVARTGPLIWI